MKKHTTRNVILMAILDVALGIVLSLYIASTGTVPAADNADTYADGAYSASAQGYESEVTVMINITGGKVTNVQIDAGRRDTRSGRQGGGKPCPQPAGCRRGTAGVDTVSGATMTSNAVLSAMDACLAQAVQE